VGGIKKANLCNNQVSTESTVDNLNISFENNENACEREINENVNMNMQKLKFQRTMPSIPNQNVIANNI